MPRSAKVCIHVSYLKHSSQPVSYTHLDVYKRQLNSQIVLLVQLLLVVLADGSLELVQSVVLGAVQMCIRDSI